MAGSLFGLSLTQQIDTSVGLPMSGALLTIYEGGTLTPAVAYKDYGLTAGLEWPNPLEADANGRLPMFWLADGTYRARLTDANGDVSKGFDIDGIVALGPSSGGGGGGGGVDPNAVAQTGDVKWRADVATLTGWVRCNGRTIGSATSGATERPNADTAALFAYLWNSFPNTICPVSTGRGASAAADFAANKNITLLDLRGRTVFGVNDMGNSDAARFTGVTFTYGDALTAAATGGATRKTLSIGELPTVTPAGTLTIAPHGHFAFNTQSSGGALTTLNYPNYDQNAGSFDQDYTINGSALAATLGKTSDTTATGTFTGTPFGSGTTFDTVSPFMLGTWFMRL